MKKKTKSMKLGGVLLGIVCLATTMAMADGVSVQELPVDTSTGGDWAGVYGDCFFLLPQPPGPLYEYPVGPGLFSLNRDQYVDNCYGGDLYDSDANLSHIDWRIYMSDAEVGAFAWSYLDDPGTDGTRAGAAQWNPCLSGFQNATWDNDRFVNDPMVLELMLKAGGDATLAYYLMNGDEECRELDWTLEINGAVELTGTIADFAAGKYVVFALSGLPDAPAETQIRFIVNDHDGTPTCASPATITGINSVISGAFISGTEVCAEPYCGDGILTPPEQCEPPGTDTCDENCMFRGIACRFTGGGVDTDNNWDHTVAEGSMMHAGAGDSSVGPDVYSFGEQVGTATDTNSEPSGLVSYSQQRDPNGRFSRDRSAKNTGKVKNGAGNLPEGLDRYTFGGQVGASTVLPPQPSGEWTHHQQRGLSGRFTFHGGTSSAPEGTRIVDVRCSDPENCRPARHAPAKQLDFDAIGTFRSIGKGRNAPVWEIPNANVTAEGHGNHDFDGTYHWFEVNIDDLGEPGGFNSGAPDSSICPSMGFGEKGAPPLADCDCPDFYRITIYDGVDKMTLESSGPNKTDVIYEVYGYIDGGNLQIHPPTGHDTH